jgi:hypothetical protein
MTLQFLRERYGFYSGKLGDLLRQLGLGGIAIIWAFKGPTDKTPIVPTPLILPTALIASSLACDFMQYVAGAIAWGIYSRRKEKQKIATTVEFEAPDWINWPALFFYCIKIPLMIAGYCFLVRYLINLFLAS